MRKSEAIVCAWLVGSSVSAAGLVALSATALSGCSAHSYQLAPSLSEQKLAASALAQAGNEALPLLVAEYQRQGLAIVAATDTEAEARSAIAELDERWQPVWQAHHALELAQSVWADALEAGLDPAAALGALEAAWCALQARWPAEVKPLPLVLLGCGGGAL